MKTNNLLFTLLFTTLFFNYAHAQKKNRPNVILIMGDDIGYSDLGCYGSEIQTPNLDKLAERGVRFRTFYNASKCNPTRSSLLTGLYNGQNPVNMATVFKQAGYTTIHTGKEHFDKWIPQRCYAKNVFDYSFYYWTINEFLIPPSGQFKYPFFEGEKQLKTEEIVVEKPPFFKTDVVTDYAIRYLEKNKTKEKPFFLYLPYNAAHYPLQAKPEDIAKYRGKYKTGWDNIRKQRYERMLKMGIIDEKYKLTEPSDNINKFRGHKKTDLEVRAKIPKYRPWNSLTEQEKDDLDLEMAVFAAMVDRIDQNIGRLVQWLKDNGQYENTVIMYLSDNGSCPYDSNRDFSKKPGGADSWRTLCAAWANVGNTPFRYFKQYGHEGGARTHFIVHYPKKIKKGRIVEQPAHIVDVFPTLLDITKADYPEQIEGRPADKLHGKSFYRLLRGKKQKDKPDYFVSGWTEKFKMFRQNGWKIVKLNNQEWELYNMDEDPTEINNLANTYPDKVQELITSYHKEKQKIGEFNPKK